MLKKVRMTPIQIAILAIMVLAVGFAGGYYIFKSPVPILVEGGGSVEMIIPALDTNGNGVSGKLITTVRPASIEGTGQVLVSVNNVVSQFDTQLSARTAVKAAQKFTKKQLSDYDIIYVLNVDAQAIEGPSAGAAMAVSALAAVENKDINPEVAITGAITEDGAIYPVGGIEKKADASRQAGIKKFLVPKGQSTESAAQRIRTCSSSGDREYCKITYEVGNIEIAAGIEVKEVSDIGEALQYFIK